MNHWAPKPNRPKCENPLFKETTEYTIKKSLSPIEKQRLRDGTPHTKPGRTRLHPGNVEPVGDNVPELYLNKSAGDEPTQKSIDPDAVMKAFMGKDEEEDTDKGSEPKKPSIGTKVKQAVTTGIKTGAGAIASVVPTSGTG